MIICIDPLRKREQRFDREGRTIEAIAIVAAKNILEFLDKSEDRICFDVYDTDFHEGGWRLCVHRETTYRVEGLRGELTKHG